MSSTDLITSFEENKSDFSNSFRNSGNNTHSKNPQFPLFFDPIDQKRGDKVNTDKIDIADATTLHKLSNTSIPDISHVIGCTNQVLKLTRFVPSNTPQTENIHFNDIIAVIPAYNEELTIGMVVLLSLQHVGRVIVVDDGSTDKTAEVSRLAGAEVIALPSNQGKIHAIHAGMKRAREIGFSVLVMIDANGLYNPHEIPYIATLVLEKEVDVVIGSRFLRNPNIVFSYQFTGKYPGFMAFSEKALDKSVIPEGLIQEPDLFKYFSEKGLKVADIPISVRKKGLNGKVKNIIIAMPAYNEEKNLPFVIKGAMRYSNTILVVDDGSSDNSALVAEEAGAIVVQHEKNQGYGGALNTIFSTARTMDADVLVIIDSDGQHNPDDIKRLLDQVENGADVAIGSRFLGIRNTIPLYRQVGLKVLDIITTAAGVKNISDSQSGFRAYGKKAISVLSVSGNGMSAGSEILIQISDHHLKVKEVPITVRYDIEGTSTYNPVLHGVSVLSNIFALINFRNPIIIFGIPALIQISLGIFFFYSIISMNLLMIIPRVYLHLTWITLVLTGVLIGCEGYIYQHYINKIKQK